MKLVLACPSAAWAGNGGEARSVVREPDRPYTVVAGDTLLCFGKSITLKSLAKRTERKPRRRKKRSGGEDLSPPVVIAGDEPLSDPSQHDKT